MILNLKNSRSSNNIEKEKKKNTNDKKLKDSYDMRGKNAYEETLKKNGKKYYVWIEKKGG